MPDKPLPIGKFNAFDSPGLRMSASTRRTRLPFCAKVAARFSDVEVLPSPGCELVTRTTRRGCSAVERRTEVRSARYASEMAAPGFRRTDGSTLVRDELPFPFPLLLGSRADRIAKEEVPIGIIARVGNPVSFSIS